MMGEKKGKRMREIKIKIISDLASSVIYRIRRGINEKSQLFIKDLPEKSQLFSGVKVKGCNLYSYNCYYNSYNLLNSNSK